MSADSKEAKKYLKSQSESATLPSSTSVTASTELDSDAHGSAESLQSRLEAQ